MFTIDITKITCLFTIHVKVKHIHITSIIYWFLYYWVVNIQCFLWDRVWYSRGLGTKSSFKQTLLFLKSVRLMQVWLLYIIKVICVNVYVCPRISHMIFCISYAFQFQNLHLESFWITRLRSIIYCAPSGSVCKISMKLLNGYEIYS